ncbi:acyl-CoA dehydrogenase family protein [Alphaproteobacteria bacterium]|jgi:alkylation response protein AidB-like acyl-CoA dehydrogenase|nr:acyl-CoA dehydrogenase family protein [Alphaproteobacteria bacterium]
MDFNDTAEEAKFRGEVRGWLEANATLKDPKKARAGRSQKPEAERLERARAWQAKKAEAGYAAITWPTKFGGLGGTPIQSVIYSQEEARFDVPGGFFEIGLGMCIPTMMAWATPEQNDRFVKPALFGEEVWCQLFSEPAAGSDVAGLQTRCERDGDDWVINGQKVWTSGAHFCDYGIIVTRSDPNVPKHKGLTFFFLDMKSPGIEIRPIRQITGEANFNEVFFTDVRVPDSQRLGAVGEGWKVALTTLMNERLAIGQGSGVDYSELLQLAKDTELETGPAIQDANVREKLADWYVQSQGLKYTKFRTLTALSKGETPGAESSIGKIVSGPKMQDLASFGMDMQGQGGILHDAELSPLNAAFQNQWFGGAGYRIAGGTDEILRNIVSEQVLGLPQDIRVDKTVPYNELPKGK